MDMNGPGIANSIKQFTSSTNVRCCVLTVTEMRLANMDGRPSVTYWPSQERPSLHECFPLPCCLSLSVRMQELKLAQRLMKLFMPKWTFAQTTGLGSQRFSTHLHTLFIVHSNAVVQIDHSNDTGARLKPLRQSLRSIVIQIALNVYCK